MKLPHTKVRFYPKVKSQAGLSSLRVSCKRALMHLVKNSNRVKAAPQKKSLKLYSTQYGHVKIMPDCLGSVEKVPEYICYKFQLFIFNTLVIINMVLIKTQFI